MVPYNKDKQPSLSQWGTGNNTMNAVIVLDKPGNVTYTNLDEISGKAVVRCTKSCDVDSIVVKLEGESRTRLLSPGGGPNNERPKPQLEYHKILYKTQIVFPRADIQENLGPRQSFTLPPGQHEYPFTFKLPFNNSCYNNRSPLPTVSMSGAGLEFAKPASKHVKKTLPPTLSGFPGEAEIRYFVKVTVTRHSFFKENARAYTHFNFIPIEAPRAAPSGSEVFARQKHAFSQFPDAKAKMKGKLSKSNTPSPVDGDGPFISVDARLPEPSILTCNSDLPLRILVKKLNGFSDPIYLSSLQISLIGNTKIRAHEVYRTESKSWIIMSKSNMDMAIGSASDPVDTETAIDDSLWRGIALPNTLAPSFETCNIVRSYQLDVRVGLKYGGSAPNGSKVRKGTIPRVPQTIVLPLRLETQLFSGIAPPQELLEAMAEARTGNRTNSAANASAVLDKLQTEGRRPSRPIPVSDTTGHTNAIPPTPIADFPPTNFPPQAGSSSELPPMYSEAPPSYEDAIATNLPPLSAPRPDYAPPAAGEDEVLNRDEKRGWHGT